MIAQLLRQAAARAMWNWRRLTLPGCVVLALSAAAGRAIRYEAAGHHPPRPAAAAAAARPGRPAAAQVSAAALARAVLAGERFTAAWVSRSPGWAQGISRYATAALARVVTQGDHAYLPATAVTGPATALTATAAAVTVSVPTNAGPVLITLIRAGTRWQAASVRMARAGN